MESLSVGGFRVQFDSCASTVAGAMHGTLRCWVFFYERRLRQVYLLVLFLVRDCRVARTWILEGLVDLKLIWLLFDDHD